MKKKIKPEPLTAQQVADMVGCSRRNIYSSRDRGLLVCDKSGLFDITDDINAAFIEERKNGKVKPGRPVNNSEGEAVQAGSIREANLKKKIADAELAQMRVDYAKKILLPTDFIMDNLIRYIMTLNTNIERIAATSIFNIGADILSAGEVNGAIAEKHTRVYLKLCHDTRLQILKELENFNPQEHKVKI